ncbi:gliding motility-associated C-terminal domain-containing protein, partial [Flavobacterium sp. SM15]|uniref:gliding motility-associated C-terminal domain-containing protein n=1 Tax=Flavobacterium sp. SM15 TaxID=2908005 RepID=UPI001EDA955F
TFNGTANATVTYTVDGGTNQTVTLDASGTATVATSALTADSVYTLVNVTSAGTPSCTQTLTGSATVVVTPLATPNMVFSYNQSCVNATVSPSPILTANFVIGGTFASTTVTVDPTTGVINLTGATAGTHQVTYTLAANTANCMDGGTYTASIILTTGSAAVTGFTYDAVYCPNSANALPQTVSGFEQGGVFSAAAGLAINPSTGEINIAGSTPGTYTVTYAVQPNTATCSTGGSSTFTLTISEALEIQVQDSCNNFMLTLTALPVNGSFDPNTVNYTWHDANNVLIGSNTATLNVEEYLAQNPSVNLPFEVSVAIEDNGCTTVTYFTVKDNPCKIIPRGISPNNDQANDNFDLTGLGVNELLIFNRYGSKVYSFNGNYTNQWTGLSDNGDELPDGTYFYSIHKNNGTTVTGWVYINRQY